MKQLYSFLYQTISISDITKSLKEKYKYQYYIFIAAYLQNMIPQWYFAFPGVLKIHKEMTLKQFCFCNKRSVPTWLEIEGQWMHLRICWSYYVTHFSFCSFWRLNVCKNPIKESTQKYIRNNWLINVKVSILNNLYANITPTADPL